MAPPIDSTQTRRMAAYSRFIAWAKIILPLVALGLLSTLFLLARDVDPTKSIPYASVDVEELAREPRVTAPYYAGVTADGAAISVSAETATPDPDDTSSATADNISARLQTGSGTLITVQSDTGRIEGNMLATLKGAVRIETSDGYVMTTEALNAKLDQTHITAPATVNASGPLGEITAGQMTITAQNEDNSAVMVFTGGVRLIYRPKPDDKR